MTALLVHPAVLVALLYLAVTLLFQFRPFTTHAQGLDVLGIVPRWKFFIPQTGRFEVAIDVRCGSHAGDLGAWSPVRMYPPRDALTWLWFPGQHRAAMLWLSAHRVAVRASRGNDAGAPETLAYQTLVRHLRQAEPVRGSEMFQFALVRQNDGGAVFTSHVHTR